MRVKLNAFHKDSSASYSKSYEVSSYGGFLKVCAEFEAEVPFSRFYTEHENVSGEEIVDKWINDEDGGHKHTLNAPVCEPVLSTANEEIEENAATGLDI